VVVVSLDPANYSLPYPAAIDIKELIDMEEVMETWRLARARGAAANRQSPLATPRTQGSDAEPSVATPQRLTRMPGSCRAQLCLQD